MRSTFKTIADNWFRVKAFLNNDRQSKQDSDGESALRSELFSAVQMELHGKTLAGWHKLSAERAADRLLPRLSANEQVLTGTCSMLTATIKANRAIPPDGEWLLDNFYLVEDQVITAHRHLPGGYSRELPRLRNGPSAGLPRVYDIALETISHGDGQCPRSSPAGNQFCQVSMWIGCSITF